MLLEALATSAALAILNARMASALVEQEKVKRELELAAEIQRNLIPSLDDSSEIIHGINIPARTVSGDFFDFFTLDDGRIAFCLGNHCRSRSQVSPRRPRVRGDRGGGEAARSREG